MTRTTARPGFTIVEVLTVVGILAILAALTAAGVSRVRMAQMQRNSEQTLTKLQLVLDQQWKATADVALQAQAKLPADLSGAIPPQTEFHVANVWKLYKHLDPSSIPIPSTPKPTDGDRKFRAASAYAYMLMRWEFPQTFQEANTAVTFGGVTLPVRSTYKDCPAGAWSGENEGAALLYLTLAGKGTSGTGFNADEATQQAQGDVSVGGRNFRVFTDTWGTPITFRRFAGAGELDGTPYIRKGASNRDPLDPKGFLKDGAGGLDTKVFPSGVSGSATAFDNTNRQPTVISAGPNKAWDNIYDMDNLVGFRLRREGAKGD